MIGLTTPLQPYALALKLAALASLVAAGFAGGWTLQGWHMGSQLAKAEAAHAEAKTKAVAATLRQLKTATAERDALATRLSAIDANESERIRTLQHENDRLRAGVASGAIRVRVNGATCPAVERTASLPQAPAGGGVDSGTGAVLGVEAGQAVFDLRADAIRVAGKLNACQDELRAITGQ